MQKYRIVLIARALAIVCIIVFCVTTISKSINRAKEAKDKLSAISSLTLNDMRNIQTDVSLRHSPVIAVFFDSHCEGCHTQLSELQENARDLKGFRIIAITNEPDSLSLDYSYRRSIEFFRIHPANDYFALFNVTSVPTSFIFIPNQEPIRKIGFTRVDSIKNVSRILSF